MKRERRAMRSNFCDLEFFIGILLMLEITKVWDGNLGIAYSILVTGFALIPMLGGSKKIMYHLGRPPNSRQVTNRAPKKWPIFTLALNPKNNACICPKLGRYL